jgi:iron complex transport system ATP-binding protein
MNTNEHKAEVTVGTMALQGISFAYGDRVAVEKVSLSFHAGERVAIVGPNGCGKSTLLKLMVGGLTTRTGRILLDGKPAAEIGRIAMARRLAMVPQMAGGAGDFASGLGGGFLVREIVLMARYASHAEGAGVIGRLGAVGFETAEDLQIANETLWAMDVHHLAEREVEALSGGERQRVAIARALAQRTPVLLLDEPTSALDLYHQLELLALLEELSAAGRIVVLVTHDLNLAFRWATRVVVMDRGRVMADGKPSDVLTAQVLEPVYRVKVKLQGERLEFERG